MLPHFTQEHSKIQISVITNKPNSNLSHQPQHMEATEAKGKEATTTNTRVMEIAITREEAIMPTTTTTAIRAVNRASMATRVTKEDTIKMPNPATINLLSQCTITRGLITTTRTLITTTSSNTTTLNLSKQSLRVVLSNQRIVCQTMVIIILLSIMHTILMLKHTTTQSHQHHRQLTMVPSNLRTSQRLTTMLQLPLALDPIILQMFLTQATPTGLLLQVTIHL
jgi:hypothetical protein